MTDLGASDAPRCCHRFHPLWVGIAGGQLVHRLLHAALVELPLDLVGEALAERRLVVDDRDPLRVLVVDDVARGEHALDVVAAAGAEDVPQALLGELRAVGRGRDLEHARLAVDLRGRDRAAGAVVAVDEHDALGGELVGDGHRLLRVAGVVGDGEREWLAVHTALGVDVLDRQLGPALHLLAERGVLAGDRPGNGDRDVGACRADTARGREGGDHAEASHRCHECLPSRARGESMALRSALTTIIGSTAPTCRVPDGIVPGPAAAKPARLSGLRASPTASPPVEARHCS